MSNFVQAQTKSGEPNLARLMKPSKFHPKGRVVIENGEVKNPKTPTTGKSVKKVVPNQFGLPTEIEIPEQAGNVTGENSVWRIAMHQKEMTIAGKILKADSPQEMYHEMTKLYQERISLGKKTDDFRPSLTDDETRSYNEWLSSQKKAKVSKEETEEIDISEPVTLTSTLEDVAPKKRGRPSSN